MQFSLFSPIEYKKYLNSEITSHPLTYHMRLLSTENSIWHIRFMYMQQRVLKHGRYVGMRFVRVYVNDAIQYSLAPSIRKWKPLEYLPSLAMN